MDSHTAFPRRHVTAVRAYMSLSVETDNVRCVPNYTNASLDSGFPVSHGLKRPACRSVQAAYVRMRVKVSRKLLPG